MTKTIVTEEVPRELEDAADNMGMMSPSPPGSTPFEIRPVNPCPKPEDTDVGDVWTTHPPWFYAVEAEYAGVGKDGIPPCGLWETDRNTPAVRDSPAERRAEDPAEPSRVPGHRPAACRSSPRAGPGG